MKNPSRLQHMHHRSGASKPVQFILAGLLAVILVVFVMRAFRNERQNNVQPEVNGVRIAAETPLTEKASVAPPAQEEDHPRGKFSMRFGLRFGHVMEGSKLSDAICDKLEISHVEREKIDDEIGRTIDALKLLEKENASIVEDSEGGQVVVPLQEAQKKVTHAPTPQAEEQARRELDQIAAQLPSNPPGGTSYTEFADRGTLRDRYSHLLNGE